MGAAMMVEDRHFIAFERVTTPEDGQIYQCFRDRWWIVHPEKGVAMYRGFAPQCNRIKSIVERLGVIWDGCEVRHIDLVMLPVDPHDFV